MTPNPCFWSALVSYRSITFEWHDGAVRAATSLEPSGGGLAGRWFWVKSLGRAISVAGAAGFLGIGLATVPVTETTEALAGSPSSVSVPVTVLGGQGEPGGVSPIVQITVGGWGPMRVSLDTGSSGLHVFAGAVNAGSGVTVTDQTSNITYAGGFHFQGVVASAVIRLGGATTTAPVSFALVQSASCTAAKPDCPAAEGISDYESHEGVNGILGIGMQSSQGGVISPILGMAGPLGKRWSLHLDGGSGQLVLGARVIGSGKLIALFQLKQAGTSDSHPLWADAQIPMCVTAGSIHACVPGLFDSGTASVQVSGSALDQVPTVPGTSQVVSGTPIAVAVSGQSPFWSFTAGSEKSADLVLVKGDRPYPFLNTGVQAFYDFTVTYNAKKGHVTLTT